MLDKILKLHKIYAEASFKILPEDQYATPSQKPELHPEIQVNNDACFRTLFLLQ